MLCVSCDTLFYFYSLFHPKNKHKLHVLWQLRAFTKRVATNFRWSQTDPQSILKKPWSKNKVRHQSTKFCQKTVNCFKNRNCTLTFYLEVETQKYQKDGKNALKPLSYTLSSWYGNIGQWNGNTNKAFFGAVMCAWCRIVVFLGVEHVCKQENVQKRLATPKKYI